MTMDGQVRKPLSVTALNVRVEALSSNVGNLPLRKLNNVPLYVLYTGYILADDMQMECRKRVLSLNANQI